MYPYFSIGNASIHAWTLCLNLSYIVAILCVVYFRPKEFALSWSQMLGAGILFAIAGVFGARLLGLLINHINYPTSSMETMISKAGMAYLGAPLLGFISLWIFSAVTMTSFLKNADYAAPFIMLSRAIGRIGCLLNGCCYGIHCNLPWAVTIYSRPGMRHPTQIYASIAALAIFITMFIQYKRLRQYKGATFFSVIMLYGFMRFFNEFLRADSFSVFGILKLSNLVMLLIFVIGLIGLLFSLKNANDKRPILKSMLLCFLSSLLWVTFIALGILTSVRATGFTPSILRPDVPVMQAPVTPMPS